MKKGGKVKKGAKSKLNPLKNYKSKNFHKASWFKKMAVNGVVVQSIVAVLMS